MQRRLNAQRLQRRSPAPTPRRGTATSAAACAAACDPVQSAMRSTISFVVMTSRPAMMNVSPTAAGCSCRQHQAAHQVVDVNALPPVRAGADHEELSALDGAEQLQQPPVARPVRFRDAHDRSIEVVLARAHQFFRLQLRRLVGIFRAHVAAVRPVAARQRRRTRPSCCRRRSAGSQRRDTLPATAAPRRR